LRSVPDQELSALREICATAELDRHLDPETRAVASHFVDAVDAARAGATAPDEKLLALGHAVKAIRRSA
jgi:hypothetical protein